MGKRSRGVLLLGFVLLGLAGCTDPARQAPAGTVGMRGDPSQQSLEANTVTYSARGVVRELNPTGLTITIEHEGIAGFMPAPGIVSFPVTGAELFEGIEVGTTVDFEIRHNPAETRIVKLVVISPPASPSAPLGGGPPAP